MSENNNKTPKRKPFITVYEMTVFAMLGAIMYLSKKLMEWAPNIHLLAMFVVVFTTVYRVKALIPIYVYVFLEGYFAGFAMWWVPYLYVWTVLWGVTMLPVALCCGASVRRSGATAATSVLPFPKKLPAKFAFIYPIICGLHGLSFGVLYAPYQALVYGLNFEQSLAWIAAGFPFDCAHAIGDFAAGFLVFPLVRLLKRIDKRVK